MPGKWEPITLTSSFHLSAHMNTGIKLAPQDPHSHPLGRGLDAECVVVSKMGSLPHKALSPCIPVTWHTHFKAFAALSGFPRHGIPFTCFIILFSYNPWRSDVPVYCFWMFCRVHIRVQLLLFMHWLCSSTCSLARICYMWFLFNSLHSISLQISWGWKQCHITSHCINSI